MRLTLVVVQFKAAVAGETAAVGDVVFDEIDTEAVAVHPLAEVTVTL